MCGLFGLLRSPSAAHPEWASDAFVLLGMLAEERGDDSSGVALFTGRAVTSAAPVPPDAADISVDGCRIVKGRGRFGRVWRSDLLLALLDVAPVAVGHTRHATQGSPADLANAAPLAVSGPGAGIVAAHNGDVAAGALRRRFALPPGLGGTDSEAIFQALAGRTDPVSISEVLRALVGRAALTWVERARPDRVHLARAALSPLAVAVDTEQNMYWASNPRWFREVRANTRVRFASAVMLREGTYLEIARRPEPRIVARAEFVPTARPADLDERVWAGFTPADRDRDRAQLRHVLHRPGVGHDTGGFATVA
ncbi:class II glutamine amidotransferase [Thermomonospora cellulosilytica]|uniref:Glutamine phosphoribosylpyrophosphate amidotransferase n=1 Tax=Thermomonospora cellulosilytica TaxID=1411118 RepID=A0A7W3R871_9ACTN|nr:class II glutamine amidotransferase [Thermomonospora cellulosilytica]MBA9003376.1 glutamine phosphoribosylpyrophosphate amidotransferase [Thermomonospora cellulosilytica]